MNKKTVAPMMTGAIFAAAGCSVEEQTRQTAVVKPKKALVAYYSWSGNTRYSAEQIQKLAGGEIREIKPVLPYPTDYQACVAQARKEIDAGLKTELKDKPEQLDDYDVIFIGSPNWWGTMAPPVAAFLSAYDLTGKTLVPFFTHGGGGMQNCERDVGKLCEKANVLKAAAFSGGRIRKLDAEIAAWVSTINVEGHQRHQSV